MRYPQASSANHSATAVHRTWRPERSAANCWAPAQPAARWRPPQAQPPSCKPVHMDPDSQDFSVLGCETLQARSSKRRVLAHQYHGQHFCCLFTDLRAHSHLPAGQQLQRRRAGESRRGTIDMGDGSAAAGRLSEAYRLFAGRPHVQRLLHLGTCKGLKSSDLS